LSHKIIIFKTFYYRGENNSSIYMNTENKETEKPQLTEDELQGIYLYLSMYYEQMTQEQKDTWIMLMNELDPEFNDIEYEE